MAKLTPWERESLINFRIALGHGSRAFVSDEELLRAMRSVSRSWRHRNGNPSSGRPNYIRHVLTSLDLES